MPSYPIPPHNNPCSFKKACQNCVMATQADRPEMCAQLECEDYTPCKKCGANRVLSGEHICVTCSKANGTVVTREPDGSVIERAARSGKPLSVKVADANQEDGVIERSSAIEVTIPGVPPPSYSESEKAYYESQWDQYQGFYRDPTAYAICHNVILLEIELNWIMGYNIQNRSRPNEAVEKQRDRIIQNIDVLRRQLPEKEAQDLSDDEKSMAMVYERYTQEAKNHYQGGVARILSPEAVALAPSMHFPVDANRIMERLGFRTLDTIQVIEKFIADKYMPKNAEELLEFFGFFLKEKYALPFDENMVVEENEGIESTSVTTVEGSFSEDIGEASEETEE